MIRARNPRRMLLIAAAVAAVVPVMTSCASTEDSVNPGSYLSNTAGRWYRTAQPVATTNAPVAVPFPITCKSPESMMGGPEGC